VLLRHQAKPVFPFGMAVGFLEKPLCDGRVSAAADACRKRLLEPSLPPDAAPITFGGRQAEAG
jgi:hypothetical protein